MAEDFFLDPLAFLAIGRVTPFFPFSSLDILKYRRSF